MHIIPGSEEESAANARAQKFDLASACCIAAAFGLKVAIWAADKAALARHGLAGRDLDEFSLLVFMAWVIGGVWCLNQAIKIRALVELKGE